MPRRNKPSGVEFVEEHSGADIRQLFPESMKDSELTELLHASVPAEHHGLVMEMARKHANVVHRAFAVTAAALVMRELYEPNAAYGMYAGQTAAGGTGLSAGRGAAAVVGTIYQMQLFQGNVLGPNSGVVNFTRGQRFFGLLTGPQDSNAGWTFVGNTVKLASDAISGIESDVSFANWRPEIVQARMIKGEYEGFAIDVETVIPFTAQCYLPTGATAAPMVEGLTVRYWDVRCMTKELTWLNRDGISYEDIVQDLVKRAEAGSITARLLERYVPTHLRRRRR